MKQTNRCIMRVIGFGLFISILLTGIISLTTASSLGSDPIQSASPQSSAAKTDVGILAAPLVYEIIEHEENAPDIRISINNIIANNDSISGFPANGTFVNSSNLAEYSYQILDTSSGNAQRATGLFTFSPTNHSFYKTISATNIPESSGLVIKTYFNWSSFNVPVYSTETTDVFSITHKIFFTRFTVAYSDGIVNILAGAKCTYLDEDVTDETATVHTYSIRDADTKEEVKGGEIEYQGSDWIAAVDVKDLSGGPFYVVVTLRTTGVSQSYSTPDNADESNGNSWSISILSGDTLKIIIIASIAVIAFVVIMVLVVSKKKGNAIERHSVEKKKEKPLEILEISKAELKKQKIGSTTGKKSPVKKLDEKGLIFNVPTWEVEEEENAAPTTSNQQISAGAPKRPVVTKTGYTLHCPGCNSWFEVDEYEKLGCPKCNTSLEVAMWCRSCSKWFDVPEPMEVDCPICSSKLSYSK